jgi:hypothetical protein
VSQSLAGLGMPQVSVWFTDFPNEKCTRICLISLNRLQPPVPKDWGLVPVLPRGFLLSHRVYTLECTGCLQYTGV